MKDPAIYLQQVGLKSLGFDPGPLDGVAGPKTAAAWTDWAASLKSKTPGSIAARMVEFAKDDLWIRETEGRNHGPGIAKFWRATSYKDAYASREPYCAAAVCFWLMMAAGTPGTPGPAFALPTTAAAFGFEAWAKKQDGKGVEFVAKSEQLEPGDIVVFEFSHVGIVEARCPKGRVHFETIEANTAPTSSNNEGGGVFRRTRERTLVRSIIRIT